MAQIDNDFVELYNMALLWNDSIEPFAMPAPVCNDSVEPYKHAITVTNDFTEKHSLLNFNLIISDSIERYILSKVDREYIVNTASVKVAGIAVDFKDFSVACDEGGYCFSFTGAPANYAAYLQCAEETELIAIINGDSFNFEIDSRTINREALTTTYSVSARSKTKRLDFPYCEPMTTSNDATTAAAWIAASALLQGITATLETIDFPLPANVLIMSNESILSGIKKIADAIGAVIQTTPTGELVVRYEYPVSPTCYADETPAMVISDIDDMLTVSESSESKKGYDNVVVSNQEVIDIPESYIVMELDETRNKGKTTFTKIDHVVYLRIYSNKAYDVLVTGGSAVKIAANIVEAIPAPEMLAFIYLQDASTSKPVNGALTAATWYGANLGSLTLVPNSYNKIRAENATAATLGVADVSYNTIYDVWAIYRPAYSGLDFSILSLAAQVN
jgi:hypothetical protein